MAHKPDLYQVAEGLAIRDGAAILSSSGPPGGDGSIQDQAPVGSIFLRTDIGSLYTKTGTSNLPSDWIILLTSEPFSFSAVNGDPTSLVICTPVILNSGQFIAAAADNTGKVRVVGLVLDTIVLSGAIANVQTMGTFTATTAQWDVVTGGVGGLIPGPYYLSVTTGQITNSAPSALGDYVVEIGLALSSTKMRLQIHSPIKL